MSAPPGAGRTLGDRSFSSADLVAGAVFVGIGLLFGLTASRYDLGNSVKLGPGMFPLVTAIVLTGIGVVIIVLAFRSPSRELVVEATDRVDDQLSVADVIEDGLAVTEQRAAAAPPQQFGTLPWRAMILVTAAIVWFACTVEGLGFLLAAFGAVVLACFARAGARWRQALVVAAGLTALSWLIFIVALGLRAPLFGSWLGR